MILWILHIAIIGLFAWLGYRHYQSSLNGIVYWTACLLKLSAGIILGKIFIHYYENGDTIAFFEEAKAIASLPSDQYFSLLFQASDYGISNHPRVLFFTKFLSFFAYISDGSYWISSLYLSFISFLCSCQMVATFIGLYEKNQNLIFACFLFIPSAVFWSSGILKDSLAYSSTLLIVSTILLGYNEKRIPLLQIMLTLLAVFVLWRVKHYLLITIILFAGILFFLSLVKMKIPRMKWVAFLILIVSITASQFIHPYLNLRRIPQTLYENNQAIFSKTTPENQIIIHLSAPSWKAVFQEMPRAVQAGLLRPSIFDRTVSWGVFHQVENTLLAFLLVSSILLLFKHQPEIDISLTLAACLSIIFLATMLALSTPNFGTLVRYKNAFMPFLFYLSSILPYQYFTKEKEL